MQHSTGSFVSPIFALFGSFQTFSELFFPVSGQISVWRVWCNVIFCLSPSRSGADCLCCYWSSPGLPWHVGYICPGGWRGWRGLASCPTSSQSHTPTPPILPVVHCILFVPLCYHCYLPLPNPWSFWLLPSNLARMRTHTNIDYTLLVIWPFDL